MDDTPRDFRIAHAHTCVRTTMQKTKTEQERETLLYSLRKLSSAVKSVVDDARTEYNDGRDVEKFVDVPRRGVRKLWHYVANYAECLRVNGVAKYVELEALWKRHYGCPEIRDAVEDVLAAEENHVTFVKEVESKLVEVQDSKVALRVLVVGDSVSGDIQLTDARSTEVKELRTYWERSKVTLFILLRHFG